MTNPINEDLGKIEAVADRLEDHRPAWEKREGDKTLKEVIADLRENLDRAEKSFNGDVDGYAHVAATLADHIAEDVKILAKGLEHADKIPGLGVDFLRDVRQFQADLTQYGKDMAQKVPQDIWSPSHQRGSVFQAERKMAELGGMIDITAIEKGLSGSNVVDPKLKHAAGLSLLERGELPQGIHREMGVGDPKAVSGRIKAFVDESHDRKVFGVIPAGVKQQRYAVIDDGVGSGFYKVALSKEHQHAQLGDFLGGGRKPGEPELTSSALTPKIGLKSDEVQR